MVVNYSTSDFVVATMSPTGTSGTDPTPTSPNIFDLAVIRYGFDYTLFVEDNGDGFDVDARDLLPFQEKRIIESFYFDWD